MLDNAIKIQLKEIFSKLNAHYTLLIAAHAHQQKNDELVGMLEDVAESSENISCRITENKEFELGFEILKDDKPTGISFIGIPGGHEFNSLLLAILNSDGKGKNLPDEYTTERIKSLQGKIELKTYMSLDCTNCPDVVQALNIMAIINPNISHTAIDGSLCREEVENLRIQAVPTVYANGVLLHVGRSNIGSLLNKLEERFGSNTEKSFETKEYDVIIAGGGPAGVTAAIYTARKGLKTAIIAERIGGQVNETVGIENITSIPYTTGKEFAGNLRKHLYEYPIDILENRVIDNIKLADGIKTVYIKGGEICKSSVIIAATGASWRKLNIPGEEKYMGHGVAFCPHCDGPFYKGKKVAVIGGGNSGVEAAIDLSAICSEVILFEFMENLKADTVLQEKLHNIPNVKIITNTQTTEVLGDENQVTGIRVKERTDGKEDIYELDGIFVQIGLKANSQLFADLLETTAIGEIPTDKNGRTAVKGIYAAGDVTDVTYKQIIIAMGEGAKAALAAFEDILHDNI